MLVCTCTGSTADDIRAAIQDGARSVQDVSEALGGVGTICELCHAVVVDLLAEADANTDADD